MTSPTIHLPRGHSLTVSHAAELINDAINPDFGRERGLLAILNELLTLIHGGQLVARVPGSLAQCSSELVAPFEMIHCLVLMDDFKAILHDKRIAYDNDGCVFTGNRLPSARELPDARAKRRLRQLRDKGGNLVWSAGGWKISGPRGVLARLVEEEKAAGRPMSDKSGVRKDLMRAAAAERSP